MLSLECLPCWNWVAFTNKVLWLQKVGSGIPQVVQWGHRNHQDRYCCCCGPDNQLLQRHRCRFTMDKTSFCFHRLWKLDPVTVCKTPCWSAASIHSTKRGALREQVRHSLTSGLYYPYYSICWCFLQSSSFPFIVGFSPSVLVVKAASLWQEFVWKEASAKSACLQPVKRGRP